MIGGYDIHGQKTRARRKLAPTKRSAAAPRGDVHSADAMQARSPREVHVGEEHLRCLQ
jgi:hypothetical protein